MSNDKLFHCIDCVYYDQCLTEAYDKPCNHFVPDVESVKMIEHLERSRGNDS